MVPASAYLKYAFMTELIWSFSLLLYTFKKCTRKWDRMDADRLLTESSLKWTGPSTFASAYNNHTSQHLLLYILAHREQDPTDQNLKGCQFNSLNKWNQSPCSDLVTQLLRYICPDKEMTTWAVCLFNINTGTTPGTPFVSFLSVSEHNNMILKQAYMICILNMPASRMQASLVKINADDHALHSICQSY